jgi:hypothetical protein
MRFQKIAVFAFALAACTSATGPVQTEGEWKPTLGGTATYTIQTGQWDKIGNHVWVSGTLFVDKIGTGSTVQMCGLPFTSIDGQEPSGSVGYYQGITLPANSLMVTVRPASNCLAFHASLKTDTKSPTIAPFTDGTLVYFNADYEAKH